MVSVEVDNSRCSGCGKCVENCPASVLSMTESEFGEIASVVMEEDCSACNGCSIKCPEQSIKVTGYEMLKMDPPSEYPPEAGRYLRGNDYSPVAVIAILDTDDTKIPEELALLVSAAVEAGAALAGTLQTENLGIEKVVANIVANPNIRYIVLCWREAHGHLPAEALECLVEKGVADDKRRTIVEASAPTPYLANLPLPTIKRFRKQVKIVNIIRENDPSYAMRPETVKEVVRACIQEKPTKFGEFILYDPGAWPEPPICEKLTIRLTEPWRPEISQEAEEVLERMKRAGTEKSQPVHSAKSDDKKRKQEHDRFLELLGLDRDSTNREEQA
ncbi:MAG: 4Fe-4S binding protein [Candidatus Thorarchaeota archaeon]